MKSFQNNRLLSMPIPMKIVRLVSVINEYKGKQELYRQQSPQVLDTLKEVSIIQSTESSNRIEGIYTSNKRLKEILEDKSVPQNRSESEIAGYRDVLNTIHSSYEAIPINSNIILQLHRDMYKYSPGRGGMWKTQDNVIEEVLPSGVRYIRFKPVEAFLTPSCMDELCRNYNDEVKKEEVEPLLLISAFVLDFLCIHPFNDGNGRMARLLTLLLLYKSGYEVGRFISLEKIIENSKESYYETLNKSSMLWHDGKHDLFIWCEYLLGTIVAAYRELENRVGVINNHRGNKGERVEKAIYNIIGYFTKEEIRNLCPEIGESTINRVFEKLKSEGKIEPLGKGRSAKWKRL